jgi:hypothetical protein
MPDPKRSIQPADITRCLEVMTALIPFFPVGDAAVQVITAELLAMTGGSLDALEYLTKTAINTLKRWEGIASLREILTQSATFTPADGGLVDSRTREQRLAEAEQAHHNRLATEYETKLAEWKAERALQITGEIDPSAERENAQLRADIERHASNARLRRITTAMDSVDPEPYEAPAWLKNLTNG